MSLRHILSRLTSFGVLFASALLVLACTGDATGLGSDPFNRSFGRVTGQVTAGGLAVKGIELRLDGASTKTDASGAYTFEKVSLGDRTVALGAIPSWLKVPAASQTIMVWGGTGSSRADFTAPLTLQSALEINIGAIGGLWVGIRGPLDPAVPDVAPLFERAGSTDGVGHASFPSLAPGTYEVRVRTAPVLFRCYTL